MNTETNCFSLFEIFDNRMGTKKKLYITKNLDVYTTRGEDPRRVIRVHWEVAKTTKNFAGITASAANTIPATAIRSFSHTPPRDCKMQ